MRKVHVAIPVAVAAIISAALGPTPAHAAAAAADDSSTAVLAPSTFGRSATAVTAATADAVAAAAEDARVKAYWTPARLASAVPYESIRASKGQVPAPLAATGPEGSTPPAAPLVKSAAPAKGGTVSKAATPVTYFSNTNGKLFFNGYGSGNAYCTASAINSDTKRVIITAGHCVYDAGAWKTNAVFVPNYNGQLADPDPKGIWSVKIFRTFNAWINSGDLNRDVGFGTLYNGGDYSQRIVDAVGGHGMTWNGPYGWDVSIFGYPSNKTSPNGRYTMWACWGTTFQSGSRNSINGCWFGPGASGGPWLYQYSNSTGLGNVRSVTSTWNASTGQNWAPYFDDAVKAMKDATNADW